MYIYMYVITVIQAWVIESNNIPSNQYTAGSKLTFSQILNHLRPKSHLFKGGTVIFSVLRFVFVEFFRDFAFVEVTKELNITTRLV